MRTKKQLDELKVGGGATGASEVPGPTGGTATLPASKKQGDSMEKIQDPNNPGQEETDAENNTKPTGDMSATNKSSIAAKASAASGSMKEEVAQMFAGQEISEEIVQAATSLFESTVQKRIEAIVTDLEEQYNTALEKQLQESTEAVIADVAAAVDKYMDIVAEKFIEENALAIESGLRSEITEQFIDGMKKLFIENYIDIPEDKVDVVESLAGEVTSLEERLNESMNETIELRTKLKSIDRVAAVESVAEGLTVTQREKFATLAEGVEFDGDVEGYVTRLNVVKNTYFSGDKKESSSLTEAVTATPAAAQTAAPVSESINKYVDALNRTLKK